MFLQTIAMPQLGTDTLPVLIEPHQFSLAFDLDTEALQPLDQQLFVFILGKDVQEGVGRNERADNAEGQVRCDLAFYPEVGCRYPVAALENGCGQVQLAVQFQGPGLHGQGPRGSAGAGGPVDDAHLDAQFAQPQGQYQPGRAGANDQNLTAFHRTRSSALGERQVQTQAGKGCRKTAAQPVLHLRRFDHRTAEQVGQQTVQHEHHKGHKHEHPAQAEHLPGD
ncbi:hypothetical protein D9M71_399150 [compost metagenome]